MMERNTLQKEEVSPRVSAPSQDSRLLHCHGHGHSCTDLASTLRTQAPMQRHTCLAFVLVQRAPSSCPEAEHVLLIGEKAIPLQILSLNTGIGTFKFKINDIATYVL